MMKTLLMTALLVAAGGVGYLASTMSGTEHLDAVTTHGEWVSFPNADGQTIQAYVAYPERSDKAPAIIVIHEIFGMTDWEPTVADDYASKGYVAIVPDLLSSKYGSTRDMGDSARRLVSQLDRESVVRDLDAAYEYINAQPATEQDNTGVIGFCWGGGTVWTYASANPKLKAAVVCYGPVAEMEMLNTVEAPVKGVYGENDARVNMQLPEVASKMRELGKSFVADSFAGTGHGFMKPGRRGSDSEEATRARREIDEFFAENLEGR
jgi:carboxymethylenebutenolidase